MFWITLGANLLQNMLRGWRVNRAEDHGIIRAGYTFKAALKKGFLMLPHPFKNLEKQDYYQSEYIFSVV